MRLQPPDQLSTLLIWLSAIFMALKTGMDQLTPLGHQPVINLGGYWGFAPLALVLLAAVISIFRGTGGGSAVSASPTPQASEPWLTPYLRSFMVIALIMLAMSLGYKLIALVPSR